MAVFYDTGGGDIYAGPTREAVIAAMKEDIGDDDFLEDEIFEVPGTFKMRVEEEDGKASDELVSLAEEYGDDTTAYCIASENY